MIQKKTRVEILVSDKTTFKAKIYWKKKEYQIYMYTNKENNTTGSL